MSLIKLSIQDHVAFLTINRPDALNAMNLDLIQYLESSVKNALMMIVLV